MVDSLLFSHWLRPRPRVKNHALRPSRRATLSVAANVIWEFVRSRQHLVLANLVMDVAEPDGPRCTNATHTI